MEKIGQINKSDIAFVHMGGRWMVYVVICALAVTTVTACDDNAATEDEKKKEDQGSLNSEEDGGDVGGDVLGNCDYQLECPPGAYCDRVSKPPVCRSPATGQGVTCTSQDDCAKYEADYCEMYVSFTCLVKNCSVELNNCSDEYLCCGFTDPTTYPESWELPQSLCVNKEGAGGECSTI